MIDPISVAALIAGLLGISAKDIVPNVRRYLRTASERGFEQKRASVRHHMLVETLKGYYGASLDSDPSPRFHFYEVEVGGKTPVRTSVVAKPEWVGLDLDLGSVPCALMPQPWTSGDGRVTPAGESTHGLDIWSPRITTEQAAKYSVLIASSGSEIYDQDLYRLENVGGFPQHLRVSFALDSYYRYRFGVGLLVEELTLALIEKTLTSRPSCVERQTAFPSVSTFYQIHLGSKTINPEFALVVSKLPAFWKKFGGQLKTNWEISRSKRIETAPSSNLSGLASLIAEEPWASQGLVSLVEGLTLWHLSPNACRN